MKRFSIFMFLAGMSLGIVVHHSLLSQEDCNPCPPCEEQKQLTRADILAASYVRGIQTDFYEANVNGDYWRAERIAFQILEACSAKEPVLWEGIDERKIGNPPEELPGDFKPDYKGTATKVAKLVLQCKNNLWKTVR